MNKPLKYASLHTRTFPYRNSSRVRTRRRRVSSIPMRTTTVKLTRKALSCLVRVPFLPHPPLPRVTVHLTRTTVRTQRIHHGPPPSSPRSSVWTGKFRISTEMNLSLTRLSTKRSIQYNSLGSTRANRRNSWARYAKTFFARITILPWTRQLRLFSRLPDR
jgi:hypothetical protein